VKRKYFWLVVGVLVLISLLAVGFLWWSRTAIQALAYDGVQVFQVGNHAVTIETQSAAITQQDSGPAQIIVSTRADRRILESWFDQDNWMDIRPGYVSWRAIDEAPGLDLLIWQPSGRQELTASVYISNGDGLIHLLPVPIKMEYDLTVRFL
jgi:hypothetical protein